MGKVDSESARLICKMESGKDWEEATEAERAEALKSAQELQAILGIDWPTHVSDPTVH